LANNNELNTLKQTFASLDKDKSGSITAQELQQIPFNGTKFSLETAVMLVKVFDKDRSGNINETEFVSLHKFITSFQASFQTVDHDKSGSIEFSEVQNALSQNGFQLSPPTIQALYTKFLNDPGLNPTRSARGLSMEMFLRLCAFLGYLRTQFSQFDYYKNGTAIMNMDNFVQLSL